MVIYFISGHLDLTDDEFMTHYITKIKTAIDNGDTFVVSDCDGADSMAQRYIKSLNGKAIIYHIGEKPSFNAGFETVGGFAFPEDVDRTMTEVSDKDIAYVRAGRENSYTAKNIKRRNVNK